MSSIIVRELIDTLRVEKNRRLCIRTAIFLHDGLELDKDDYLGQYKEIPIILIQRGFITALTYIINDIKFDLQDIIPLFLTCCKYGQINIAGWLLNKFRISKKDLNGVDNTYLEFDGFLPLELACCYGQLDMVKWINKKFRPTADDIGNHTFIEICRHGYLDMAKYVYTTYGLSREHCMKFNNAAFHSLCTKTDTSMIEWLQQILMITKEEFLQYNKLSLLLTGINGNSQMQKWLSKEYSLTEKDCMKSKQDLISDWSQ
jgi:hypothetical protein